MLVNRREECVLPPAPHSRTVPCARPTKGQAGSAAPRPPTAESRDTGCPSDQFQLQRALRQKPPGPWGQRRDPRPGAGALKGSLTSALHSGSPEANSAPYPAPPTMPACSQRLPRARKPRCTQQPTINFVAQPLLLAGLGLLSEPPARDHPQAPQNPPVPVPTALPDQRRKRRAPPPAPAHR